MQGQRGRPQAQQEAYLLAVRFTDLRQRWVLPLQRLIANCVQVHVGEKGKNGAHAFAAVVHLHVCSGWGRCCGAGTRSYLTMTYSKHITVKGERKPSLPPSDGHVLGIRHWPRRGLCSRDMVGVATPAARAPSDKARFFDGKSMSTMTAM